MYVLRKMRGEVLEKISNAVGYANFFSHSHDALIRVDDDTGSVIETHEHAAIFKEW
jgi:hypothetical protein